MTIGKNAIVTTSIYKIDYREWKAQDSLTQTWLNFKTYFAAAYARLQEYQRTAAKANFHGAHNMTGDIKQKTNALQEELDQFLANIAGEYPIPPPQKLSKQRPTVPCGHSTK